ncbi:MAG: divK [Bryobacterales bacterium]|nr:divK [Bryobacterales bacterium]
MARILLVEDNETNRDMLSRRLVRRGFDVVMASDGEEGIASAGTHKPDLILMDVNLPGVSGWEAIQHLKANDQTKAIPVIAVTAHALSTDREKAMAIGCDGYEAKPVDLPNLLAKIESLLHNPKSGP